MKKTCVILIALLLAVPCLADGRAPQSFSLWTRSYDFCTTAHRKNDGFVLYCMKIFKSEPE